MSEIKFEKKKYKQNIDVNNLAYAIIQFPKQLILNKTFNNSNSHQFRNVLPFFAPNCYNVYFCINGSKLDKDICLLLSLYSGNIKSFKIN
jgi:hypothetical protein